ncbi:MAG: hypothetical protein JWO56_3007 [Acidobacteria bacterium]|nr:hypothetical protein [Acidobacteriota bacterium]
MRRLLFAALLLATIATSLPPLVRTARLAIELRGLPYRVRRERLMGAFYPSIGNVLRATPSREPLALIPPPGQSRDSPLLFDYYAYPRRTRIYEPLVSYGHDPAPPRTVVRVGDVASLSSYGALRLEALQRLGPPAGSPPLRKAGTHFFVPVIASIDGATPGLYVTHATLASQRPARVTMTFWPRGIVRTFTVERELHFDDLVHEAFGRIDRGWLEVASSEPLRASFPVVSNGTIATEIAIVRDAPRNPLGVPAGRQLWLVNLTSVPAGLLINGKGDFIAPHDTVSRALDCPCQVRVTGGEARVYAFATERTADGGTRFIWPEAQP